MRTSGNAPDLLMTSIPLSVVLLYLLISAGGPIQLLKATEKRLQSTVDWTLQLIR